MNGPTTLENSQPHFVISPDADPANRELLVRLEAGILEHPQLYGAILDIAVTYGDDAQARFSSVDGYLRDHASESENVPEAWDHWTLFMRNLSTIAYDYTFDAVTEDAIENYQPIRDLLNEGKDKRTRPERQQEIKNEVKFARLRFFIGRAATLKGLETTRVEKDKISNKKSAGSAA